MSDEPNEPGSLTKRLSASLSTSLGDVWKAASARARDPVAEAEIASRAAAAAPVVWLLGKVQSGKSSIVRGLTGASEAEIGSGFKACTATARIFEHPAEAPVIRFLDTRGIGEAAYDHQADIAFAEAQAQLLLVVMKATDAAQDAVLDVVAAVRARKPDWPILVAQTSLHEGYMHGAGHIVPYPFDGDGHPTVALPGDLGRMLAWQREQLAQVPGRGAVAFVPLDFTREDDGLAPALYGIEALHAALVRIAPDAVVAAIEAGDTRVDLKRRAGQQILGYAMAAGAADAFPVAGAVAVPAIQAKLLHSLADVHGVAWDRRMLGELAGALGAGVLTRMATTFGARQLAKLIPVYGQTAGAAAAAAMSFATTYALGKAAQVYLERRRDGGEGTSGVKETYEEALRGAFKMGAERFPGRTP